MTGQITLSDVIKDQFFDRYGNRRPLPHWVKDKRCGNCQFWEILPECDQPPNGWGIRGYCSGYTTSQTSYCDEWRQRTI